MIQQIELIELDDSLQLARVKTHEEKIDQYAEYFMERNDWGDFPPIDVVLKDGRFQIADGIHRFRAAKRVGFETAPCIVTDGGDDDWTLLEKSVEKNGVQGIDMDFKDWEQFRRLILTKLSRGEIHNRPLSDIAKLGHCHPSTITRMRDKMKAEGWTFPETAVGADGKEYPTQKKKSVFARAKTETEPSAPPSFCANGCGTPIWEANKADPNYTYVEDGGKWFCSPECAEEYKGKPVLTNVKTEAEPEETPEPWEPEPEPEEAFEPVKHETKPEISEEEENQRIAEEIAETLKNFKALRINSILILIIKILNLNINNLLMRRGLKNSELSEEEKTGFVWKLSDGSEWELPKSDLEALRPCYPAINIEEQLLLCIAWSISNPAYRKTEKGILKHINHWLTNEQNKARKGSGQSGINPGNSNYRKSHYVSRDAGLDFENLDYGP